MNLAIVGATGLVGRAFLKVLEEYGMRFDAVRFLASERSAGSKLTFFGKEQVVEKLSEKSFDGIDLALFSAGSHVSSIFAPIAVDSGAAVIDNSSCWRGCDGVPLIVPEVNFDDVGDAKLIANPNCSTIAVVPALNALRTFGLKTLRFVTFQAVSGAGKRGVDDLERTKKGDGFCFFSFDVSRNVIPQIGDFLPDYYTAEEHKMATETRKILHLPDLAVSATCVRVPIPNCHTVVVSAELRRGFDGDEIFDALKNQSGVKLLQLDDSPPYPVAEIADGQDLTYVGRVRRDSAATNGVTFVCTADNLRKGAAANAVQIARKMIERGMIRHD